VEACDNKVALRTCQDQKEGQISKHIDIVHHFAGDRVISRDPEFVYWKTKENISECLTKALLRGLLEKGLAGLGMSAVGYADR
jgi:hypothetical protein